jgi:hypothetical protein
MNFLKLTGKLILPVLLFFSASNLQANLPATCPVMTKRNNGNGQASSCAGEPGFPVATNVASPYNSLTSLGVTTAQKTGDFNFMWFGQTLTEMPIIRRVWVGSTLTNTVVGPPSKPTYNNGNTYTKFCFYKYNLPNQGTLTLEFAHPTTGAPLFLCCYNLTSGANCTPTVSCAPTINTHPASKTVCGTSTTFTVDASGVNTYQWQLKSPSGSWTTITNTGDFTGATTQTLSINTNLPSYTGYQFKAVLIGSSGTCTTESNIATLTAYPKPTATFHAGAIVCGVGTYNLRINFTGTGPWSFTYTTNGASPTTVSNIAVNPYYLAVSPASTTTYAITNVNDRYCSNVVSSPVTLVVQAKPTITLSASSFDYCYNSLAGKATVSYTGTTNTPTVYSITAGTRAMPSYTTVTDRSKTFISGPGSDSIQVSIPAGTPAGTYDFNLSVKVASPSPGCASAAVPFTIVVKPAPALTVTASAASVCPGGSVNLLASPNLGGGYTYAWSSSPAGFTSSIYSPSATPSVATTYTATVTDNTAPNCSASGTVTVTMKAVPTVSVNNATICLGDKAVLTAAGAATYSWALTDYSSAASTLTPTSSSTVLANPTSTLRYAVTGTNSVGCTDTAQARVLVNSIPSVSVTSSTSICPGSNISLTASGASTYTWAPSATLSASTGTTVTATPTTTTTYTVTGANGTCYASASTTITINNPVTIAPPKANSLL